MFKRKPDSAPDLQTQLEQLLDQVWNSERLERLTDRIDAIVKSEEERAERAKKRSDQHG